MRYPQNWVWGKTDRSRHSRERGGPAWNPLTAHCLDVAAVTGALFDHYLAASVRAMLVAGFGEGDPAAARLLVQLLAACHDMPGKADPGFLARFTEGIRPGDKRELKTAYRAWLEQARQAGLPLPDGLADATNEPHQHVTAALLPSLLGCPGPCCGGTADRRDDLHTAAILLGGHHGTVPGASSLTLVRPAPDWIPIRQALLSDLTRIIGIPPGLLTRPMRLVHPATLVTFTGLVVLADWIASDESRFPYRDPRDDPATWWNQSRALADEAIRDIGLTAWRPTPRGWDELFRQPPRPTQQSLTRALPPTGPAMVIIEDDTGSGKSECAFCAAHHLAAVNGHHGFYLALPTRAASEQIAARVREFLAWASGNQAFANLAIVHGTAAASAVAQELAAAAAQPSATLAELPGTINITEPAGEDSGSPSAVSLHPWFSSTRRGLLSPFGIGTLDQVVLAAQRSRHWCLRLFGLANKVVVIDEAHAYEMFQQQLLADAIRWLADAGSSVVILSATLPASTRDMLTAAWCEGRRTPPPRSVPSGYPSITIIDASGTARAVSPRTAGARPARPLITHIDLDIRPSEHDLAADLLTQAHDGGIIAVILNRVRTANALFSAVRDQAAGQGWGSEEICLLHARTLERYRIADQDALIAKLGPRSDHRSAEPNPSRPHRLIVIATQVLEQSLDIDVDLLITDLAPIDLLLQRRGRLHRHAINDPGPPPLFTEPAMRVHWWPGPGGLPSPHPQGDGNVYSPYLLARTWQLLQQETRGTRRCRIETPRDSQRLIDFVYGQALPQADDPVLAQLLTRTYQRWRDDLDNELNTARQYGIAPYLPGGTPIGVAELASRPVPDREDDPFQRNPTARSRLGSPSFPVTCLFQKPGQALTWDIEGRLPADLGPLPERRPATIAQRRRRERDLVLNTAQLPAWWYTGNNALSRPAPGHQLGYPALVNRPTLVFDPHGNCVRGCPGRITFDRETGFALT